MNLHIITSFNYWLPPCLATAVNHNSVYKIYVTSLLIFNKAIEDNRVECMCLMHGLSYLPRLPHTPIINPAWNCGAFYQEVLSVCSKLFEHLCIFQIVYLSSQPRTLLRSWNCKLNQSGTCFWLVSAAKVYMLSTFLAFLILDCCAVEVGVSLLRPSAI